MKAGREHRVSFAARYFELLGQAKLLAAWCEFVFLGRSSDYRDDAPQARQERITRGRRQSRRATRISRDIPVQSATEVQINKGEVLWEE